MILLFPVYSIIAFTIWQDTSRQPLLRRIVWAVTMTVGAMLLVGLPAFFIFSRRWYWLYRTVVPPEDVGVGRRDADGSSGYLDWAASGGKLVADRLTGPMQGPVADISDLTEPWASLLSDAIRATTRIARARSQATGPEVAPIQYAVSEATATQQALSSAAFKGAEVDQTRRAMDSEGAMARLQALDAKPGLAEDLEAARRSLRAQLEASDRLSNLSGRLEGQLLRMVAQLGEAAARAEELSLGQPGATLATRDLTASVDRLASIRTALKEVEGIHLG